MYPYISTYIQVYTYVYIYLTMYLSDTSSLCTFLESYSMPFTGFSFGVKTPAWRTEIGTSESFLTDKAAPLTYNINENTLCL
jgi:hypothetical protein